MNMISKMVVIIVFSLGLLSGQYSPPGGGGSGGPVTLTGDATGSGTGTVPTSVVRIQGNPVSAIAPSTNQSYYWNGSSYVLNTIAGLLGYTPVAPTVVTLSSLSLPYSQLSGTPSIPSVTGGICTNQVVTVISTSAVPTCTTVTIAYVDSSIAPTASPALTGSPTAPTQTTGDSSTKLANTAFVSTAISNAIAGNNPAVAVLSASTVNITGTYSNGASGIGATFTVTTTGAFTLDGVSIGTTGQRVLLKNQSSGFQNGVYTATIVGSTGISPVFTRALDYDQPSDINTTGAIPVQSGTVNTTTSWLLTSTVNTIGTDALTFVQFSIAPSSVVTQDANGNVSIAGGLTSGGSTGKTGYQSFTGKTSGSNGFTVPDTAGTAILYMLPTVAGAAGQSLQDTGSATCPTLPSGAPALCHQLLWVNPAIVEISSSGSICSTPCPITTAASATSMTWSSIPGSFTNAKLKCTVRSQGAGTGADAVGINFNGDTTAAHYVAASLYANGTTTPGAVASATATTIATFNAPQASVTANYPGGGVMDIPNYAATTFYKTVSGIATYGYNTFLESVIVPSGHWLSTAAITSISLTLPGAVAFVNGSQCSLYLEQ